MTPNGVSSGCIRSLQLVWCNWSLQLVWCVDVVVQDGLVVSTVRWAGGKLLGMRRRLCIAALARVAHVRCESGL